ncbi:MAG TPA: methylated-DNA--[protein]-cysteine S-methyltransferase [Thermoanaerobaculia bacterium]|nr:methylated-DNA--[protein]-cysteine S-methyltransferase [Thermoanaerobaculia bacterium]
MPIGYARFDTDLGRCVIAWSERGLVRVRLPEVVDGHAGSRPEDRGATEAAPPPFAAEAICEITAHLRGDLRDFLSLPLDLSGVGEFPQRVYAAARTIPAGRTATYGDVAERAGAPGEARAVGRALGANPIPLIIPCHRIVDASGGLRGFSAPGGTLTKGKLLALEGVGLPLEWA